MGRYYSGDIEGKFWFGVQNSDDASFFGGEIAEPSYIEYYFGDDNIDKIKEGIEKCKKELGKYKGKLDKFFKDKDCYNDEILSKEFKVSVEEVKYMLEWYARLELGEKILACVEKNGDCSFEAEL